MTVGFSLLAFCWGFLHLCSSGVLTYSLLFLLCPCLILMSGWCWAWRMNLAEFPPLQYFWNSLRRIEIKICRIQLWSHLVLGFSLLGNILLLHSHTCYSLLVRLGFPFLLDSILVGCTYPGIYPFPLGFPVCWHTVVKNSL